MSGKLKEVRERMKSVRSTQQITSAMKMVSAAKLRRAQDAITQMRPYAVKLNQILKNILSNVEGGSSNPFGTVREAQKVLIVVVTSSRGLCGAFNTNVIKGAVRRIDARYADVRRNGNLSILCIGKKGYDFFRKGYKDCTIIRDHVHLFQDLSFSNTSQVAKMIMEKFSTADYDRVDVAYGIFKNPGNQFAAVTEFLPVQIEVTKSKARADYIFEPDQETLLLQLVPNILQVQFQRFLLDTHASEHGARMTAMDKATENAEELIKELRINYNKARQEAITKELSEIVGGAAALEG
jgi:F-type H+-transporting ATPase subunit gamma